MTRLAIHPLTPERWDDFVELFETDSITRNCWCMATRLSGAERREFGAADRRKMLKSLVRQGDAPGLLAYDGDTPVGWIAVAPRSLTPDWNRGRKASAVEAEADAADPACWGASCFFVRADHRKQGMTADLLDAAMAHASDNGADRLEACPMAHDDKRSTVGLCVGPKRVFERAGFETVVERKAGRPLMRASLAAPKTRKSPNKKPVAKRTPTPARTASRSKARAR